MALTSIALLTLGVTATGTTAANSAVTAAGAVATAGGNAVGFTEVAGVAGDRLPTVALGTAIAKAGAAIAAGAAVEVGTSGKVITKTSGVAVARALTAAAADGDLIEVMVIPN
ncbi:capsid cement protein [Noviherbaspirillum sp. Root189]|uniref:capsid cement protein n=1 Tax=Noviherbaspirillum sp. Root189 TaxID=1736487 RepID=UPI000709F466|nr:capsid cement protein [Noviherbaspirillum sp. Root189]KRB73448.1 hypothetical protein ASE07_06240 [Noviherbaspirillum sp. Root189]